MRFMRRRRVQDDNVSVSHSRGKDIPLDFADARKLTILHDQAMLGVRNYLLFQRFPSFKWPYWVPRGHGGSEVMVNSPVLLNRSARDLMCFSSQFSRELLRIDPSGMLTCMGECWSLEFWWLQGGSLMRPQNMNGEFSRVRDPQTSVVSLKWKCKTLDMTQSLYGARGASDEVLVKTDIQDSRPSEDSTLFVVLRPYSNDEIGGLESAEFRKHTKSLRIQGVDRVLFDVKPDIVAIGNGNRGDVSLPPGEREQLKTSCKHGMASLAVGFRIKKGSRTVNLRIGLSPERSISSPRFNYEQAAREYADFSRDRLDRGTKLEFSDKTYLAWFDGCKSAILHHFTGVSAGALRGPSLATITRAFHVCSAGARMGYTTEAMKIAVEYLKKHSYPEQRALRDHLSAAYVILMYADSFLFSRDSDSLREHYPAVQRLADVIVDFSSRIRAIDSAGRENSIDGLHLGIAHAHDYAVLLSAVRQSSYLARCAGIFGDETRYGAEVERLKGVILNWCAAALAGGETVIPPEFAAYCVTASWPFGLDVLTADDSRSLVKLVADSLPGLPVYNASCGGWDSYVSLVLASNMLLAKDERCFEIIGKLTAVSGETRVFSDFINPSTSRGVYGEGDSPRVIWAMSAFLRNALFVDYEHRLEIMPIPRQEWFAPGSEVLIRNAPSRFGPISIRILALAHELQYHFTELPKFVPPEIMINLPFRAKIKPESDFILKKEIGNSYIINGWPSVVRFVR